MKVGIFIFAIFLSSIATSSNYVPYREFAPYKGPFINNCSNTTKDPNWLINLKETLRSKGVLNRLVTNKESLAYYAEDYGHWVHNVPVAAFAATSAQEVSVLIKAAFASRSKGQDWAFQVVNRGGSGNTGGFAQNSCGAAHLVLDLSAINRVNIKKNARNSTAWVGAGSKWETLVVASRDAGMRPTVVPDYLAITVGGIVSIGGFGTDAVKHGPVINQIISAQIVQPNGDIKVVSSGDPYFSAMKGGMGQFGVFIRLQFPLVKNEPKTRVFHALVPSFHQLSLISRHLIKKGLTNIADGCQGFAVQNNRQSFRSIAPPDQLDRVNKSLDAINANGKSYVYYLEFLIRGSSNLPTLEQAKKFFGSLVNPDLVFFADYDTFNWDNRLELTAIPFLVSIGAWQAPHPWGSFNFDASAKTEEYFDSYLQNQRVVEDLGSGLIALYPFPTSNSFTSSSHIGVPDVKGQDIFWHTTLGRTAPPPGTPSDVVAKVYANMAEQNKILWNGFDTNGSSASFYPCGVLPNTTTQDWRRGFSPAIYDSFKKNKATLDPKTVFADVRNLF
eukprot:TRINITY_DN5914_c0_g1_i2.p1 TRINITY_DN5914_c0_g1~~TRINITY_DN5914_c0_g1_i2.p1  ORF type:complete len:558 (-),score=152.78 TRINITY_DN5914_c0_g1_i2:208-1881(-)